MRIGSTSLTLALAMGAFASPAAAQDVGEVRVEGNRRAEKEAVLGVVRTKVGAPLDPETISEDIRRIWSLRTSVYELPEWPARILKRLELALIHLLIFNNYLYQ